MEADKIIEGNVLIAEFLGWRYSKNIPAVMCRGVNNTDSFEAISVKSMQYHTSWDWLMPAVEKIARLKLKYLNVGEEYNPYPTTFAMPDEEGNLMVRFHANQLFTAPTLIEATWLAVIDFIKWYNQQSHDTR